MTFGSLPAGASVFLDANTFVHYFQPHQQYGPACRQLMQRIDQQQLVGFTSLHVLGEMAHRLLTLEASQLVGWSVGKVVQRLKHNPSAFQQLTRFQTAIDDVLQSRIQVLSPAPPLLGTAAGLSRRFGLLINDVLIVTLMNHTGITQLASSDTDFDRVPGITRYGPV
jgi:predicted nucleic acid-binding protein